MKFMIVDAFTETRFGGNPAGVVFVPDGEDFPSDEVMVKTAAELRYSETAFIRQLGPKEFNVRYFTPAAEVDLCGHATIGSFCALQHGGLIQDGDECMNHTLSGDIQVGVRGSSVMMDMAPAVNIQTISEPEKLKELYDIMGARWEPERIAASAGPDVERLLPQLISTGLPDIMMPLATQEDLNAMEPDMKALSQLSEYYHVTGVHAFTLDSEEGVTAHTRNFAPLYDIDEEAATGTSSGALTYYFYLNGVIAGKDSCVFIQGEKMDRPSRIETTIDMSSGEGGRIRVGGSAVVLAEGEIHI